MRFGCCLNMTATQNDSIGIEHIEELAACSFDYVELPLAEMMELNPEDFKRLLSRLQKSGIACEVCNNFFPKTMRLTGGEADENTALTYAKAALARAAEVGAKIVVFGSGKAKNVPTGFSLSDGYIQIVHLLKKIDAIAEQHKIKVAIEPLRSEECNLINSFEEGCKLARDVDGTSTGVLVDFYHMVSENEPVDHILKDGKEFLIHTHMANPSGRIFPAHLSEADYESFIQALHAVGYEGRMSCEAYTSHFSSDASITRNFFRENF